MLLEYRKAPISSSYYFHLHYLSLEKVLEYLQSQILLQEVLLKLVLILNHQTDSTHLLELENLLLFPHEALEVNYLESDSPLPLLPLLFQLNHPC